MLTKNVPNVYVLFVCVPLSNYQGLGEPIAVEVEVPPVDEDDLVL